LKRANLRRKWSTIPKAAPIFVADAHRDDGKRFVVRADEKPTAFLELESAISGIALSCLTASPLRAFCFVH
jgi:hypothetical protein